MRNAADVTGAKPIADISAINFVVAFYDIHEKKK
jgi:hypothetical protein